MGAQSWASDVLLTVRRVSRRRVLTLQRLVIAIGSNDKSWSASSYDFTSLMVVMRVSNEFADADIS
jgi:hypothetical protein